jgi:hypothetical protein
MRPQPVATSLRYVNPRRNQMLAMNRRTLAFALAVVATSVPVALAGTQTLTKAQVIKRGSAICRAAERRVEATPSPRSQNPFANTAPKGDAERAVKFMAVYASSLSSVRAGLGKLVRVAPPQGRSLLVSFVSQLGPTIADFRAGHTAALTHHYSAALADVQHGFRLFARASVKTKAYGFPKGVCQSGSS